MQTAGSYMQKKASVSNKDTQSEQRLGGVCFEQHIARRAASEWVSGGLAGSAFCQIRTGHPSVCHGPTWLLGTKAPEAASSMYLLISNSRDLRPFRAVIWSRTFSASVLTEWSLISRSKCSTPT